MSYLRFYNEWSFRYRLYYVNDTLRGAKKPPRTADELSAAPVGVEFEITGMGGVYLLVVSTDGVSDSNTVCFTSARRGPGSQPGIGPSNFSLRKVFGFQFSQSPEKGKFTENIPLTTLF